MITCGRLEVRALVPDDLPAIQELHNRYFNEYFDLPDLTKMLCGFTITSDDKIIMAGGVRKIAETILVTDKSHPSKIELGRALVEAQNVSRYVCQLNDIQWLHAFVEDEQYAKHLIKHGFNPRSKALWMRV